MSFCSYEFDVDPKSNAFKNRRVFAYVDTGIADGIQLDAAGNVYAGTGDGVQVGHAPSMQPGCPQSLRDRFGTAKGHFSENSSWRLSPRISYSLEMGAW